MKNVLDASAMLEFQFAHFPLFYCRRLFTGEACTMRICHQHCHGFDGAIPFNARSEMQSNNGTLTMRTHEITGFECFRSFFCARWRCTGICRIVLTFYTNFAGINKHIDCDENFDLIRLQFISQFEHSFSSRAGWSVGGLPDSARIQRISTIFVRVIYVENSTVYRKQ